MMATKPTVREYDMANEMVDTIKGREVRLMYRKLRGNKWYISVFTDAALSGLPDNVSSAYGVIIFISNGYVPRERRDCCVIHWKAAKVRRVISGPYDGEILALSEGLEEGILIRKQLLAMTGFQKDMIEVEAFCDNKNTIEILNSTTDKKVRGKVIGLEIAKVKEMRDSGEVKSIDWLEGSLQLADGLTKLRAAREPILQAVQNGRFMY